MTPVMECVVYKFFCMGCINVRKIADMQILIIIYPLTSNYIEPGGVIVPRDLWSDILNIEYSWLFDKDNREGIRFCDVKDICTTQILACVSRKHACTLIYNKIINACTHTNSYFIIKL